MYNNCGCDREFGFNDGCEYNRSEWDSEYGCSNDYYNNNAALYEAECVTHAVLRRRNRENRYAHEFVRCMKNARYGYQSAELERSVIRKPLFYT